MANTDASAIYRGDRLIIFTTVYVPVQVLCIALRYLARYLVETPWGLDDAVIMTSIASQICMAGLSIASVKYAGVGHHILYLEENEPDKVMTWGKYLMAISTLYFVGVNIPKLAILALYRRLFPNKSNRIAIYIVMGTLVGLTLSTVVTVLAACSPFAANWNPELPNSHCIDKEAFFRYGSLPNIITDIVMLILPVRVVWKLHTSTRLKIGLTITFLTGSFGLITAVVRFTAFFQQNSFIDGTWTGVDLIIWTQIEPGVYLISACLMTYRPLLDRIGSRGFFKKIARKSKSATPFGSDESGKHAANIPLNTRPNLEAHGFRRLGNDLGLDPRITVTTNIQVGDELR